MAATITQDKVNKWWDSYLEVKDQRVGQSFCNYFNITDEKLFYETDPAKCFDMIRERYVFSGDR